LYYGRHSPNQKKTDNGTEAAIARNAPSPPVVATTFAQLAHLDRIAARLEWHLVRVEQPDLFVGLHVAFAQKVLLQRGKL